MFALQCFVAVRIIYVMSILYSNSIINHNVKCNQFIDDDKLTDKSSLIHLLDRHDADDCDEIPLLKHSPFYSKKQFTSLLKTNNSLCILDMYIANAFTKLDKLEAFIKRVNKGNPISVICLNECWLSEIRDDSILNLTNYNHFNQIGMSL